MIYYWDDDGTLRSVIVIAAGSGWHLEPDPDSDQPEEDYEHAYNINPEEFEMFYAPDELEIFYYGD